MTLQFNDLPFDTETYFAIEAPGITLTKEEKELALKAWRIWAGRHDDSATDSTHPAEMSAYSDFQHLLMLVLYKARSLKP